MFVDWDKTRDSIGSSFLHLPKPIKDLMDIYTIIKTRFFEGRKPQKTLKDDWLDDEHTPFFLNSSGSPFRSLDLTHLSEAMGIDVTGYSYRRIVSTWALSHPSEEIRSAETETLQHSLKVANDAYMQNKQLKPQKLTQTYLTEECLLPKSVRDEIRKTEVKVKSKILQTEEKMQKRQNANLIKENVEKKQLKQKQKPLGAKHRILEEDRIKFKDLIEELTGEKIEDNLKKRKPLKWRNFFVRAVCSAEGKSGEDIRNLWCKVYKGDLKWGVRDVRLRAQVENWPRRDTNAYLQTQDRNSWISYSILKSLQTHARLREKKNLIKPVE